MKVIACIPARYSSKRLPGKPLLKIGNKTIINHTYAAVSNHPLIYSCVVLTDDERIANEVGNFGGNSKMTSTDCNSGTERILSICDDLIEYDIVLNVQGDEPFISHDEIDLLLAQFSEENTEIATLASKMDEGIFDFNKVKVVFNKSNNALYFSRQAIPAVRDLPFQEWKNSCIYYQHLGVYGFRQKVLQQLVSTSGSEIENMEHLEQLRWLYHGYNIKVGVSNRGPLFSIDTEEDLVVARRKMDYSK